MQIAILSDIHDQVWHLGTVLGWLKNNPVEALIVCGDLCSPFILAQMQNEFSGPIHIVFGNNDGDTYRITDFAKDHVHLHGELAELAITHDRLISRKDFKLQYPEHDFFDTSFTGKRIAVNHYPEIAFPLAESGLYNLVCYGHNHKLDQKQVGKCLFVNPGTIMGYSPAKKQAVAPSFLIYDSEVHGAKVYRLDYSFANGDYQGNVRELE